MYRQNRMSKTSLERIETTEGESIEEKINRIVNNKEPITDGAPIIYTERKDGVQPSYDIRTDRFEIAVEAMDAVSKSKTAEREKRIKEREESGKPKIVPLNEDAKGESTQGKTSTE